MHPMDDQYYKGILKRWDDQRGFGFIVAEQGEVFFHISALKESVRGSAELRPREGDILHYQIQPGSEDKPRAANVRVETRNPSRPPPAAAWYSTGDERPRWPGQLAFFVVLLGGIGVWGYLDRSSSADSAVARPAMGGSSVSATTPPVAAPARHRVAPSRYSCDGRVYCSQMTSCAEAKYFIRNCPGTKMDGNHDGVPCERQWCRR